MTSFFLPREKMNVCINKVDPSSSQETWLIVFDKGSGIVKLFNVVSSILLKAVLFLADQIFNDLASSFFDSTIIEKSFVALSNFLILYHISHSRPYSFQRTKYSMTWIFLFLTQHLLRSFFISKFFNLLVLPSTNTNG